MLATFRTWEMRVSVRSQPENISKTYEWACTPTDNDKEARKIWCIIWQSIASVIHNGRIVGCSVNRQCICNREGEGLEIGDRVVNDTVHRSILKWNHSAIREVRGQLSQQRQWKNQLIQACDRNDVDTIPWAGRIPRSRRTLEIIHGFSIKKRKNSNARRSQRQ